MVISKYNLGILRGESLFRAELSDICSLVLNDEGISRLIKGPMQAMVLIMQIAIGKTNKNKTLYGRVMRNKDVRLCAISAFGLYLLSRNEYANETFNFESNQSWYHNS